MISKTITFVTLSLFLSASNARGNKAPSSLDVIQQNEFNQIAVFAQQAFKRLSQQEIQELIMLNPELEGVSNQSAIDWWMAGNVHRRNLDATMNDNQIDLKNRNSTSAFNQITPLFWRMSEALGESMSSYDGIYLQLESSMTRRWGQKQSAYNEANELRQNGKDSLKDSHVWLRTSVSVLHKLLNRVQTQIIAGDNSGSEEEAREALDTFSKGIEISRDYARMAQKQFHESTKLHSDQSYVRSDYQIVKVYNKNFEELADDVDRLLQEIKHTQQYFEEAGDSQLLTEGASTEDGQFSQIIELLKEATIYERNVKTCGKPDCNQRKKKCMKKPGYTIEHSRYFKGFYEGCWNQSYRGEKCKNWAETEEAQVGNHNHCSDPFGEGAAWCYLETPGFDGATKRSCVGTFLKFQF